MRRPPGTTGTSGFTRMSMFVLSALAAAGSPALAQGWMEIEHPPNVEPRGPVTRVGSRVEIAVDTRLARVEVRERFRNDGGAIAEGSYLYPMAGEAAFSDFSLWMGEQELRGEAMDADRAREIYESIVRRKKDPALLTLAGHGLIRAQVFPIQPGETRQVALRYNQLLARQGDALRLRYALGLRGGEGPTEIRVSVAAGGEFGTPYSPTHQIETRTAGGKLEITVAPGAVGDLELFLPLRRPVAGLTLVSHAPGGENGYFMLLLAPPPTGTTTVPRDLTLVVDVSGSMGGAKLEQAKVALTQALASLGARDRFRVIAFSSAVRAFRPDPAEASAANLAAAREFVDGLSAEGGTNISGALEAALAGPADPERLGLVVFVTDGLPSIGERAPDRIAADAAARGNSVRIFPVGVGHDVNTYLLDRLAAEGRGSVEYVPPGASVETAVGTLLAKLRHPALVDLRIAESPVELSLTQPSRLPDLFAGEELVVFGRYRGQGKGPIVVTGTRAGGRERIETRADFPELESQNEFIPRLWATRRVGELTRQVRLEGGSPALVEEIRDLALRHGILTEYTSYLVQEPEQMADRPVPLPTREEARSQTGQASFDRARASAKLAESKSLQSADELAEGRLKAVAPASPGQQSVQVAGRIFVRRAAVWTDIRHADRIPVTEVAAFTQAYFELVRMLPEVAPYLSVGDEVLIAGRRGSVRISPRGIQTWGSGQLAALVRNFRGT